MHVCMHVCIYNIPYININIKIKQWINTKK